MISLRDSRRSTSRLRGFVDCMYWIETVTKNVFSTKTIPSEINFKILIVLWRPKGPNQTLHIRILDRYGFQHYLDILSKTFFYKNNTSGMNFKVFIVLWRPKGPNQTLRIRILDRYGFQCYTNILSKTFFYKNHIFWNESQDIHCSMTPEGTKPDAKHQNPLSIRFSMLSRHLAKNVFLQKPYLLEWMSRYSLYYDARRDQTRRYASESAIDTFSALSRHLEVI